MDDRWYKWYWGASGRYCWISSDYRWNHSPYFLQVLAGAFSLEYPSESSLLKSPTHVFKQERRMAHLACCDSAGLTWFCMQGKKWRFSLGANPSWANFLPSETLGAWAVEFLIQFDSLSAFHKRQGGWNFYVCSYYKHQIPLLKSIRMRLFSMKLAKIER